MVEVSVCCSPEPELRTSGNSLVLFQNPRNRLDRYVPVDSVGLNYLKFIRIKNPETIENIKNGSLTIQEALDIRATILEDIALRLENPDSLFANPILLFPRPGRRLSG